MVVEYEWLKVTGKFQTGGIAENPLSRAYVI